MIIARMLFTMGKAEMTLKQKTIAGAGWNGIGNIVGQALRILSTVVMARLLSPDDFGVYAILMVFIVFVMIFGEMGTSQAIIHLTDPDQGTLSSIFFLNVAAGGFLFLVLYLLAPQVSLFFENTSITGPLRLIALSLIISTFGLVQKALLEKEMRFKGIVVVESLALTAGVAAGIVLAVNGYGVYSLVVQALLNAGLMSAGFWLISGWRPDFYFSFGVVKRIFGFTANLTGFGIINYFARYADDLLIGKYIGPQALGVYSVAYRIMLYPLQNVSRVLVRVLFPAFSKIKDDNRRFREAYLKALFYIALVTFPVMTGLFAVSGEFVAAVFGDRWMGMADLLRILAPIGMMQSIVTTVGSIFTAKGTTNVMLRIGSLNAVVTVLFFIAGLPYGIIGVAAAYAVANLVMFYPNVKVSWRQIDLGVAEGLKALAPVFIISVLMALFVRGIGFGLSAVRMNQYLALVVLVASGAALYALMLKIYYKSLTSLVSELRGMG